MTPLDGRQAFRVGLVALSVLVAIAAPVIIFRQADTGTHRASDVVSVASPSAEPKLPATGTAAGCPTGVLVANANQLSQALAEPKAGAVIVLAAGTFEGRFVAKSSGTAEAPITLCGGRDAVIDGGDIKDGYALHLNAADWWRVIGFTIKGAQKGIVTDHAHHLLLQNLFVHDVGDEGIHLRAFSTDNIVDGNTVRNTGLLVAKFGEGIYVGTAHSNWCKLTECNPDKSDHNVIRNNNVSNTTAENIDIKEGTTAGVIENNTLSGEGMNSGAATAWVNVKGNEWTITGNIGRHSIKDGFQVHRVYNGWGERNVFRGNQAEVNGPGFGIYVQSASLATVVACDNSAAGAARGMTNAKCA
jgi:nitrous oxidase accessory protein NosD